jgi:hypothetical protein
MKSHVNFTSHNGVRSNYVFTNKINILFQLCFFLDYHILCCNMFVFACPIIARNQCWLFALRANTGQLSVFALTYPCLPSNIRICPQISVFAPVFNFRYLRSGLKDYMSKYKERWCIKICIKSYFNQINTF